MDDYDYSVYYRRFHDETEEHARKIARRIEGSIAGALPEDRSAAIVDVGCGFGFAMRALRSLGYSDVQGIEASAEQASACARAGLEVHVCRDTAEWLAQHPGRFDVALLLDVLEHVAKPRQIELLRAIHRSLRPGGRIILTVPNASAILASRWLHNDFTHHCSFTEHSLHFVLANGGFDRIAIDAGEGIGRFPRRIWRSSSRRAIRRWIVRWCWLQAFKAELPDEDMSRISFELNLKAVAFKT